MNRTFILFTLVLIVSLSAAQCAAQASANAPTAPQDSSTPAQKVPVIDGAAGPCSLELNITSEGQPVYAASVKVHIAYGFGAFHKLDLEASTNVDGKVKFVGLPARPRRSTLEFQASKDQMAGTLTYNPDTECQTKHDIALVKTESGK
jgi:hypothetical protein